MQKEHIVETLREKGCRITKQPDVDRHHLRRRMPELQRDLL